jgi:hypothetical protein
VVGRRRARLAGAMRVAGGDDAPGWSGEWGGGDSAMESGAWWAPIERRLTTDYFRSFSIEATESFLNGRGARNYHPAPVRPLDASILFTPNFVYLLLLVLTMWLRLGFRWESRTNRIRPGRTMEAGVKAKGLKRFPAKKKKRGLTR